VIYHEFSKTIVKLWSVTVIVVYRRDTKNRLKLSKCCIRYLSDINTGVFV
jgi:hypothetical protein